MLTGGVRERRVGRRPAPPTRRPPRVALPGEGLVKHGMPLHGHGDVVPLRGAGGPASRVSCSPPACSGSGRRRSRDLEMAVSLIDALTSDWDPTSYRDTYRDPGAAADRGQAGRGGGGDRGAGTETASVTDPREMLRQSVEWPGPAASRATPTRPPGSPPEPPTRTVQDHRSQSRATARQAAAPRATTATIWGTSRSRSRTRWLENPVCRAGRR